MNQASARCIFRRNGMPHPRVGIRGVTHVIDPDPKQELPSPGRSEIDGHEEGDAMDTDEEDPEEDPVEDPDEEPEED